MRKENFADKIRNAFLALGPGREVTNAELAEALDLVGDRDKRPMYAGLRDFKRRGEISRPRQGVHVYIGAPRTRPELRTSMWSVVRMRKTVVVDDLMALTGARESYAKQFLQMLVKRGCVERISQGGGKVVWRLVKDVGPNVPENDEKAAYLRRLREKKKEAMSLIDSAGLDLMAATDKLIKVRIMVNDMPEGMMEEGRSLHSDDGREEVSDG